MPSLRSRLPPEVAVLALPAAALVEATMHLTEARRRFRWWFMCYRVAYGKPMHGPPEPQWLVQIMGRRFVVRYCAKPEGGW